MKKAIMILVIAATALGLTACRGAAGNQSSQAQATEAAQRAREAYYSNVYESTSQEANQNAQPPALNETSTKNETPTPNEMTAGRVEAIDGMNITISTSHAMLFHGEGQHIVSPGTAEAEPPKPQETTIRVTDQTTIKVNEMSNITGGGQMADLRAGTLDYLTLQAFVMAEGEWQDDEFVATTLTIMN